MSNYSRTTALELMMDVMPRLRQLLDGIAKHDRNLAQQARRSASSVISNHGEADGQRAGHRKERILTARGSLYELRAQLKLAAAWGYLELETVDEIVAHLDRVGAMTTARLKANTG